MQTWVLGRAAVCDCGTPRTFLLPFFLIIFGVVTSGRFWTPGTSLLLERH